MNKQTYAIRIEDKTRDVSGYVFDAGIDALTLEDPEHDKAMAEKRERELYEKRMRGDWS